MNKNEQNNVGYKNGLIEPPIRKVDPMPATLPTSNTYYLNLLTSENNVSPELIAMLNSLKECNAKLEIQQKKLISDNTILNDVVHKQKDDFESYVEKIKIEKISDITQSGTKLLKEAEETKRRELMSLLEASGLVPDDLIKAARGSRSFPAGQEKEQYAYDVVCEVGTLMPNARQKLTKPQLFTTGLLVMDYLTHEFSDSLSTREDEMTGVYIPFFNISHTVKFGEYSRKIKVMLNKSYPRSINLTYRSFLRLNLIYVNLTYLGLSTNKPSNYVKTIYKYSKDQRVPLSRVEQSLCIPYNTTNPFVRKYFPNLAMVLSLDFERFKKQQRQAEKLQAEKLQAEKKNTNRNPSKRDRPKKEGST